MLTTQPYECESDKAGSLLGSDPWRLVHGQLQQGLVALAWGREGKEACVHVGGGLRGPELRLVPQHDRHVDVRRLRCSTRFAASAAP